MDIQVHIQDKSRRYCSGDIVLGRIQIQCRRRTTILELTAALIGESSSSLIGASGLLFSKREKEAYSFLRRESTIIPSSRTSETGEARSIRLDVGCYSFDFQLRIPFFQDCSSSLPDTPAGDGHKHQCYLQNATPKSARPIPPSTNDIQEGNKVAYRVDVSAIASRNMFESRTVKSCSITIWPNESTLAHHDYPASSVEAVTTARATILGGSLVYTARGRRCDSRQIKHIIQPVPAEILISATFQPRFRLVQDSSADPLCGRKVQMDISVTKLNQHPHALYLQSFQMLLVGYTDIRAGVATHGQMSFWTLQSLSNLDLQIFTPDDATGAQRSVESRLWENVTLDDGVVPDFATCNLTRRYELEVLMGWQCQSGTYAGRVFFVQARTPVRISSGIWRNEVSRKSDVVRTESVSAATVHDEHSQWLCNSGSRKACARLSSPPTYDEAVRAAVNKGLSGFESRNAGGW